LNIFGHEDQNFQWSKAYSYYSSPPAQKDVIWASRIARAGCVPEVFDCKELVAWCVEKYVSSQRIIQLQDHSPISLSPQVFRKMLKLPEPTLTFKREELFKRLTEIDLAGGTNEVQDPKLILNSMFLTKQQFDEQVEIFKGLSVEIFYGILEYNEDEIDNWLVDYSVKNQDIEEASTWYFS
jgi:hypothetical protein